MRILTEKPVSDTDDDEREPEPCSDILIGHTRVSTTSTSVRIQQFYKDYLLLAWFKLELLWIS